MNYLENRPKDSDAYKLEIVRIMPTLVIGPILLTQSTSSVEAVAKMLNGEFPGIP